MKVQLVHRILFLGFMILLVSLGKLCANDVAFKADYSKNSIAKIVTKNVLNSTPSIIESGLEYDDSQTFQKNLFSSDSTIQSLDLLFGYNSNLLKKVTISHFLLYSSIKRHLLHCIFLI